MYINQLFHLEIQEFFYYPLSITITLYAKAAYSSLLKSAKMKLFIAAALFTLGLAAPVTETKPRAVAVGGPFSCPGGLTNSSPMCCSVNVLGLLALDCHNGSCVSLLIFIPFQ